MEDEIKAAIAEQEEHIKRQLSCGGVVGTAHAYRPHGRAYRPHGRKGADKTTLSVTWSACVVCGVTETRDDYAKKIG